MATSTNLLTAEQYWMLPDLGYPTELVRGEIVMMNMTGFRHGYVCGNIYHELRLYLTAHPLGTALTNDSGIITQRDPDSVRGPDVSFFSYQRLPAGTIPKGYPTVSADLVFEVLSPSDSIKELRDKAEEYLKAAVTVVCLIDPDPETVVVIRSDRSETTFELSDILTLDDVLPGFAVEVRKFFGK